MISNNQKKEKFLISNNQKKVKLIILHQLQLLQKDLIKNKNPSKIVQDKIITLNKLINCYSTNMNTTNKMKNIRNRITGKTSVVQGNAKSILPFKTKTKEKNLSKLRRNSAVKAKREKTERKRMENIRKRIEKQEVSKRKKR